MKAATATRFKGATLALSLGLLTACAAAPPQAAPPPPMVSLPARAPRPDATTGMVAVGQRADAPAGFVELEVGGVVVVDERPAVILVDASRETAMPIFVGGTEAMAIDLRLHKQRYPRPLTHDLLDQLMAKLGGRLIKIHIGSIRNDAFIGTIFVQRADRVLRFDARPSDAIALALGSDVPIFVAVDVIAEAGIRKEQLLAPEPDPTPKRPESI